MSRPETAVAPAAAPAPAVAAPAIAAASSDAMLLDLLRAGACDNKTAEGTCASPGAMLALAEQAPQDQTLLGFFASLMGGSPSSATAAANAVAAAEPKGAYQINAQTTSGPVAWRRGCACSKEFEPVCEPNTRKQYPNACSARCQVRGGGHGL